MVRGDKKVGPLEHSEQFAVSINILRRGEGRKVDSGQIGAIEAVQSGTGPGSGRAEPGVRRHRASGGDEAGEVSGIEATIPHRLARKGRDRSSGRSGAWEENEK